MGHIEKAHKEFYVWAHGDNSPLKNAQIGVAHNVANNEASGYTDLVSLSITENLFKFAFPDAIKDHLDWMGLNYYGTERIEGASVAINDVDEYSESGRMVDPNGFFAVLKQFYDRYSKDGNAKFGNRYIITENGVSDGTDILRPSYIVEHLLALREAQRLGMNIEGYVHWTISDNWEWADGYCPKFGLVNVDREDNLKRIERPSYEVYSKIVKNKAITLEQRDAAWELVRQKALRGENRTFCRAADGQTGLDSPIDRPVSLTDWRFRGLSQTEDGGCTSTPWEAPDKSASVGSDGWCTFKPGKDGKQICPAAIKLYRKTRCAGEDEKVEKRGFFCGPVVGADQKCVQESDPASRSCCCDEQGKCAPLRSTKLAHYFKFWTRACPPGMTNADKAKCGV